VKNGTGPQKTDLAMQIHIIDGKIIGGGKIIGRNLKRARRALGMGQGEFGRLLAKELKRPDGPYSIQAISKWERGGRQEYDEDEVKAFAKILKRERDFFVTTENEIFTGEGIKSIVAVDDSEKTRIPLIDFEKIAWDVMDNLIESATEFFETSFPLPKKKEPSAFRLPNNCMEPRIKRGSVVAIARGLKFQPDQVVFIQIGEEKVIGTYQFEGDLIVVKPDNPKWKVHRFTAAEWKKDVKEIGVVATFETSLLVDFPPAS
jgi:transcriptional regulator with XRE-family HTH domain